jgi:hypothetical protein
VFVSGLTLGDYLLWNWSLSHNHDVLALISGLTLPPLAVAAVWLLALSATRLIARSAWRAGRGVRFGQHARRAGDRAAGAEQPANQAASARAPSRKLAA